MKPRAYQQATIDALYDWFVKHPDHTSAPIVVSPTGSGKSILIAELVRLFFDTWPDQHPRSIIITPSRELAEQNADKLARVLPSHISIGYYSASVGQKCPDRDVIVATIGSIYRNAHLFGNIKMVIIDECHLVSPDGAGMYRQFLTELATYCKFRTFGLTATPFRGNGVWLTSGTDPLFCGIAHETKIQTLIDQEFLSPLIRPVDALTMIDSSHVEIGSTGDYKIDKLSDAVSGYLPQIASEAIKASRDRKKWIAFAPTVENAESFSALLNGLGVPSGVVCGETKKTERQKLIDDFRCGKLRCLVSVIALATGFDVPDIDCIIWIRPTISPVLYVQGAGRGMRIAPGKTDCLWLDFTDTTSRLGPVDAIKGRGKGAATNSEAPFVVCNECGEAVRPANALVCPNCGAQLRNENEEEKYRGASNSAIMLHQVTPKIARYEITKVTYHKHHKEGSLDSMRVEYRSGFRIVAREWVCILHPGFAYQKAVNWVIKRLPSEKELKADNKLDSLIALCFLHAKVPTAIIVNESSKYPEIVSFEWEEKSDGQENLARHG